jgi:ATP-binding cassette, subfamily B, bacterial
LRDRLREVFAARLQLARMLGAASPWLVVGAVSAAAVSGLLPVGLIVAAGSLAARVATALAGGGSAHLPAVYWAFVVVMALFLASEVMVPLQNRLRWLVTKRLDGAVRLKVMHGSLAGTDMTRLHGQEFLDAMRLARGLIQWSATPGAGAAGLIGVLRDYLTGLAAAVVVATFQPVVALIALAVALVVRVQWRAAIMRIINVWIEGSRSRREAWYFTELGLGRAAASEVRLFGLRQWIRQRIATAGVAAWTPTWRQRKVDWGRTTTVHVLLTVTVGVGSLVWAAQAMASGRLGVGGLVAFVSALFATLALGRSFDDDVAVEYGAVTLPAVHTLERLASESLARETGKVTLPEDTAPAVELRGVWFRYPGTDRDVLRDVDLTIPAGASAALVGMNGAGKTTLIKLLCGLYPPHRGVVMVGGVDLRAVDLDAWHRLIAPMFQEFVRLPATVRDNVAVGAIEHLDDTDSVRAALAEAGALRFSKRLSEGLDSLLATRYADGTDLSGGQWQRLGIARALFAMRHGARFLVLDEPTSNLDTSSEERLIRRLLEETKGSATTLLVTHRLALARRTDRIFVVEHGHVVESGTHEELIELGGRYASAFSMQASLYPLEEGDG